MFLSRSRWPLARPQPPVKCMCGVLFCADRSNTIGTGAFENRVHHARARVHAIFPKCHAGDIVTNLYFAGWSPLRVQARTRTVLTDSTCCGAIWWRNLWTARRHRRSARLITNGRALATQTIRIALRALCILWRRGWHIIRTIGRGCG